MVDEAIQQEILQKQREAEQRVRRMREENRRLAQRMGACEPEERTPPPPPTKKPMDQGRLLALMLAFLIGREGGSMELVLALLYLAL